MIEIDRFTELLDALVGEIPEELFEGLNGGVNVSEGFKLHPAASNGDLFVMGEYTQDGAMGKAVTLYYGSFVRILGDCSEECAVAEMRRVLRHELRHHIESRAMVRDLEVEDERFIESYLREKE